MNSIHRFLVAVSIASAVALTTPSEASAFFFGEGERTGEALGAIVGVVSILPVPFLIAEVAYAIQKSWLPARWALPQLFAALGLLGGNAGMLAFVSSNDVDLPSGAFAASFVLLSVGGWLFVDSILSFVLYREPEPPPVSFAVVPSDGGVTVALTAQTF